MKINEARTYERQIDLELEKIRYSQKREKKSQKILDIFKLLNKYSFIYQQSLNLNEENVKSIGMVEENQFKIIFIMLMDNVEIRLYIGNGNNSKNSKNYYRTIV